MAKHRIHFRPETDFDSFRDAAGRTAIRHAYTVEDPAVKEWGLEFELADEETEKRHLILPWHRVLLVEELTEPTESENE